MDDGQSVERSGADERLTQARLAELEAVIGTEVETLKQSAQTVADALAEIKREQLYRWHDSWWTWEDYTRTRWNMTPQHANRIIRFGQALAAIAGTEPMGSLPAPTSERQVRPLAKLETDEDKRAAWDEAVERAGGAQPTGRLVEDVVRERLDDVRQQRPRKVEDVDSDPAALFVELTQHVAAASERLHAFARQLADEDLDDEQRELLTKMLRKQARQAIRCADAVGASFSDDELARWLAEDELEQDDDALRLLQLAANVGGAREAVRLAAVGALKVWDNACHEADAAIVAAHEDGCSAEDIAQAAQLDPADVLKVLEASQP